MKNNNPNRIIESILVAVIITMIVAGILWTTFVVLWYITIPIIILIYVIKVAIANNKRRALIKKYTDFIVLRNGYVVPPRLPLFLDRDIREVVWKEFWKTVNAQNSSQARNSVSRVSNMGGNQTPQVTLPNPDTTRPSTRTSRPVNTSSTTSYTTSYTTGYTTTPSDNSYNSSSNTNTSTPVEGKKKKKKRWYYPTTPKKPEPIAHQYFIQPLDEEEEEI